MHALKYLGNVMTDKTFTFLHQFYGIYKTRITLTIALSIIYLISIILCSLKIMPFFAVIVAIITLPIVLILILIMKETIIVTYFLWCTILIFKRIEVDEKN